MLKSLLPELKKIVKNASKHQFAAIIFAAVVFAGVFLFADGHAQAQNSVSHDAEISTYICNKPFEIIYVRLEDIRIDGAKVYWETDVPALCVLYYGPTSSYTFNRTESSLANSHYFDLTQLEPSTIYHYKIYCTNAEGETVSTPDLTFSTSGPATPTTPATSTPCPTCTSTTTTVSPSPTPTPPHEEPPALIVTTNWLEQLAKKVAESALGKALFTPMNVAAALLSALSLALPAIMNLPMLGLFDSLFSWFLSIIGWYRKRKNWGTVYDAESGKPVPMAVVRIFEFSENRENKHMLESVQTDNEGRYGFAVKPGNYYLDVIKNYYTFPSKITKIGYHSEKIEVKDNSVVAVDIPVDPDLKHFSHQASILSEVITAVQLMRIPILVAGTFLAIMFYFYFPVTLNFIILVLYFILWSIELYNVLKPKGRGNVFEKMTIKPLPLSIIRVFNKKTDKLIATKVTDYKGHYYYFVSPGEYYLRTVRDNYEQAEIKHLVYKQGTVLDKDIYLKKLKDQSPQQASGDISSSSSSSLSSPSSEKPESPSSLTANSEKPIANGEEPTADKPVEEEPFWGKSAPVKSEPIEPKPEKPSSQMAKSKEPTAPEPSEEAPIVHAPVAPVVPVVTEEPKPAKPVKPKKTKKLDIIKKKKSSKKYNELKSIK